MKRLIIISLIFISSLSVAQKKCNLVGEFAKIYKENKVIYKGTPYLYETVKKLDSSNTCARFVNNNKQFIHYLLSHFSKRQERNKILLKINDTIKLQYKFIDLLKKDTIFVQLMNKLSNTINTQKKTDTITMDKLSDISVKYFYIFKIEEGNYAGKVCGGKNGILKTEKKRLPFAEAFAFSAIFDHYNSDKFNMYNEFVKGIKELYKLELGIEKDEKLLRAQGAMYMFMKNNQTLKDLLIYEYEKKKQFLPFILKK